MNEINRLNSEAFLTKAYGSCFDLNDKMSPELANWYKHEHCCNLEKNSLLSLGFFTQKKAQGLKKRMMEFALQLSRKEDKTWTSKLPKTSVSFAKSVK